MPLIETKGAASAQGFGLTLGGAAPVYIEDVFSTWLYTGNGSTQTINNGIDLAGKGGLVWVKNRGTGSTNHLLMDTARTGASPPFLSTNNTAAQVATSDFLSFNSNGFSFLSNSDYDVSNQSGQTYASWTFREQSKFFDVVTYTGNGTTQAINHNLGSKPGFIIVKRTSGVDSWITYHQALGASFRTVLNLTNASLSNVPELWWGNTVTAVEPTSTQFTVGNQQAINASGETYVAYLFAHDAGGFGLTGTDNVISCGSYTGTGSSVTVDLGYEPQWILTRNVTDADDWFLFDNMRGIATGGTDAFLRPNLSNAENTASDVLDLTATGFKTVAAARHTNGKTYIYIAIRRGPMKTPTSGTSVFAPVALNSPANGTQVTTNFPIDLTIFKNRESASSWQWQDRLRGLPPNSTTGSPVIYSDSTSAEQSSSYTGYNYWNTGFQTATGANASWQVLRRAPGFFDEVCYTGNGSTQTITHNLGVTPELIIAKNRTVAGNNWPVLFNFASTTMNYGFLNLTNSCPNDTYANVGVFSAAPTSTSMFLTNSGSMNASGSGIVAYLFASCPGVSKVFNYTGNGSSQTINCGFTGGARFVMIKRTDSTGDWYVWDTARGIVANNDPHLSLNSTAAEVTTNDTIDTDSTGFVVNQVSATNVNVNGASYIGLAIA